MFFFCDLVFVISIFFSKLHLKLNSELFIITITCESHNFFVPFISQKLWAGENYFAKIMSWWKLFCKNYELVKIKAVISLLVQQEKKLNIQGHQQKFNDLNARIFFLPQKLRILQLFLSLFQMLGIGDYSTSFEREGVVSSVVVYVQKLTIMYRRPMYIFTEHCLLLPNFF